MSEFSPRIVNVLQRSLQVVAGRRLYGIGATSLALLAGGCVDSAYAPSVDQSLQNPTVDQVAPVSEPIPSPTNATMLLWEQSWSAVYRHPISGEEQYVQFGDRTESMPALTTCPSTFEVRGADPEPDWTIVVGTCTGFTVIPVEVPVDSEY